MERGIFSPAHQPPQHPLFSPKKTWGSPNIDEGLAAYDYITTHQPGAQHAPYYFVSGYLFSQDILQIYHSLTMPVWMVHGVRGDFVDYTNKATGGGSRQLDHPGIRNRRDAAFRGRSGVCPRLRCVPGRRAGGLTCVADVHHDRSRLEQGWWRLAQPGRQHLHRGGRNQLACAADGCGAAAVADARHGVGDPFLAEACAAFSRSVSWSSRWICPAMALHNRRQRIACRCRAWRPMSAGLLVGSRSKPEIVVGHSAGAAILARMCLDKRITPRLLVSLNGAFMPFGGMANQLISPLAQLLVMNPLVPRAFAWQASNAGAVERLIAEHRFDHRCRGHCALSQAGAQSCACRCGVADDGELAARAAAARFAAPGDDVVADCRGQRPLDLARRRAAGSRSLPAGRYRACARPRPSRT